jgi:hypothetical protein
MIAVFDANKEVRAYGRGDRPNRTRFRKEIFL